ncbi:MAG: hypothetical protein HPY76_14120 [Anaerolineae bacterium]|nr:hypothetical protein [Anaerolineae bacterium]
MSAPVKRPLWLTLCLVVVFLAGLLVRLYDLTDPPADFHPARQYHSATLARGLYAEWGGVVEGLDAGRAMVLGNSEPRIEPPIMEHLAALTYLLAGRELLWIPRLYAILFWLLGGLALAALARRAAGDWGVLIASLFYLLLPYGVSASRAFQPDPLMTALLVAGLWLLVRWWEKPTWRRALWAGLAVGAAVLAKQSVVFIAAGAFLGSVLAARGLKGALRDRQVWLMAALMAAPVLAYNFYGLTAGNLGEQYTMRFFPQLWLDPGFYLRWTRMIDGTVGILPFLLALVGLALLPRGGLRAGLLGWFAGYLVYGFVFAHHIGTHDYYQLPLIPLVALGLAAAGNALVERLLTVDARRLARLVLAGTLLAGSALALYQSYQVLKDGDYRAEPAAWRALGAAVDGDSAAVTGIFDDYGAKSIYYAGVLPTVFPSAAEVAADEAAAADFAAYFAARTEGKRFFVVADDAQAALQPWLIDHLQSTYPLILEDAVYAVYQLAP